MGKAQTNEKHPKGFYACCITFMFERLAFYGAKPILLLFLITATLQGGLGIERTDAAVMAANLLAVNVYTKKAEMRSIDKKKYKVLKKRLKYIKNKYEKNKDKIRQEYREEQPYLVSREFWNKYLEIEKYQ